MNLKKLMTIATAAALSLALLLAGCTTTGAPADSSAAAVETSAAAEETTAAASTAPAETTADATSAAPAITGSITAAGSSALQPLAQAAADKFTADNPGATIQVQGGGSGAGLTQVSDGSIDIGDSDLFAEEKLDADKAAELVDHKVCVVGFAAVVNSKVTVTNLTSQQLIDIFTGKISNWKDVGGPDLKIVILNRPASSGTRATFKKYALGGKDEAEGVALTEDSSGAVSKALKDTDGAISYLAFSYLKDNTDIKALQFEGVDPTAANVAAGKYPIWSYEHMYTKGEATGLAKAFIDYMMSDAFKATITDSGYIANSDMTVSR